MGLKVIEEEVEKEVTFLKDVDVSYVSLVRHGANQMPFRVVKSEKGDKSMRMIVQSILVPKGVTLGDLQVKEGLQWLADANSEEVEKFEDYDKLVQKSADAFVPESLNLVKLDDSGVYALVGSLTEKNEATNHLTLGQKEVEKVAELTTSPMDTVVAEESRPAFVLTFRDVFEKELGSFLDVVRGSLSQSVSEPTKRKKMVMDALTAFKSFLAVGLDTIGAESTKVDSLSTDLGGKDMFENKEEFAAAVGEVIKETVPALVAETMKTLKEAEITTDQTTADSATAEKKEDTTLADTLKVLADKVDDLTLKWDNSLETDPAAGSEEEPNSGDGDPKEKSVFAGMLTTLPA